MGLSIFVAALAIGTAQDRLPTMPGYDPSAVRAGRGSFPLWFQAKWSSDSVLEFRDTSGSYRYDVAADKVSAATPGLAPEPRPIPQNAPARGRQFTVAKSADGKYTATYSDGNIKLTDSDGGERSVTQDGNLAARIKYGTASWVYGEELEQREAMGFSPDGKYLWYYRFDESKVPAYYLTTDQRKQLVGLDVEAYPKPGLDNPIVDLYIYDVAKNQSTKVKVRSGEFDNGVGHYVYAMSWLSNSKELIFHRLDRRQKIRELCAANPATGEVRVVDRYENPGGWVDYGPLRDLSRSGTARWLIKDDKDGFDNLYWLDIEKGTRTPITHLRTDVDSVVQVDTAGNQMFFTVYEGPNPYERQLYRCALDGSNAKRLTELGVSHNAQISPDRRWVADVYQSDSIAPKLRIIDATSGAIKRELTDKSLTDEQKSMTRQEWVKYRSLDDKVDLYMTIEKPKNMIAGKKYPILFDVYGGPLPGSGPAYVYSFATGVPGTDFVSVSVFPRGGNGRGRDFRQAIYRSLGRYEIDDMAAAAKALRQYDWADTNRVGINGTSYGGYASAMAIVRYPDLFQAACASSMVSDWRNYDTTYTERYMDLLENNPEGYAFGSVMTHAKNLRGWLMLYYGTADNNTHPANTLQLCDALTKAGKSYELQVGVDNGHSGVNYSRMMEFFIERLLITGPKLPAPTTGGTL